jgi:hypothetical protein
MDNDSKKYLCVAVSVILIWVAGMLAWTEVSDLRAETATLRADLAAAAARQDDLSALIETIAKHRETPARPAEEQTAEPAAWHETVAQIVTRETGGRDYRAAALVAYCIYNGIQSTGLEPEVFLQTRQYNLGGYPEATDTARLAVSDVFNCHIFPIPAAIEYYYAPAITESPWHESLGPPALEYAGHRYFTGKERG